MIAVLSSVLYRRHVSYQRRWSETWAAGVWKFRWLSQVPLSIITLSTHCLFFLIMIEIESDKLSAGYSNKRYLKGMEIYRSNVHSALATKKWWVFAHVNCYGIPNAMLTCSVCVTSVLALRDIQSSWGQAIQFVIYYNTICSYQSLKMQYKTPYGN